MRQLTGLDAQFLALETPSQYGHVGSVAVLDPSTTKSGRLDLEDIQAHIAERLPLVPPFRWRLAEVPFSLDYPYWIDDIHFDLDFHVRELAIPEPYSDEKLAEQVSRIFARPLDRSRPLWELYLIHGLPDGNIAMLTKIHHAVVDGMSGNEILGAILDLTPEGRPAPEPITGGGDPAPAELELFGRALLGLPRYPLRVLQALPTTLPNLTDTPVFSTLPGAATVSRIAQEIQHLLGAGDGPVLGTEKLSAPRTSFNGRISPHRRVVMGTLPLADFKAAKARYGCTVNDVVVSTVAGTVRRWLLAHDELPEGPLVAQIPVSVRTDDQQGTYGNRILLMSAPLYTNEPDPVARLLRTHDSLSDMKKRHRALPAELLQDANSFIPPAVFSRAARATFALASSKRGRPTWNMVISNVPGPPFPLYCAGAELVGNYPVSVITDGMGLNITVMSYRGDMDFGLVADREQMPDLALLMGWLGEELAALGPDPEPAAKPKPRRKAPAKPRAKPKAKSAAR